MGTKSIHAYLGKDNEETFTGTVILKLQWVLGEGVQNGKRRIATCSSRSGNSKQSKQYIQKHRVLKECKLLGKLSLIGYEHSLMSSMTTLTSGSSCSGCGS